jgi:hypothetical protein
MLEQILKDYEKNGHDYVKLHNHYAKEGMQTELYALNALFKAGDLPTKTEPKAEHKAEVKK